MIVAATVWRSFPLLVAGAFLVGLGSAVNLQARFAATDLARPERRGRDLSLVVWAVTIGAVAGPNMVLPGAALSEVVGLPAEAGPFLISGAGMALGAILLWTGLRPDPLLLRQQLDAGPRPDQPAAKRPSVVEGWRTVRASTRATAALVMLLAAHTVMVAVMSMTPLHLQHVGGAAADHPDVLTVIGFTISLHVAGMYALSPVMGWAADRIGGGRTALGGLAVLLAAVAAAGLGQGSVPLVTVGLVLLGLGWSAATVAAAAMLVEAVTPSRRVTAQGLADALMSAAGAGGSLGAGLVMGVAGFGGLNVAMAVLVVLVAMYVMRALRRSAVSHSRT